MKNLTIIFLLFISFKSFACSCAEVKPILEFYSSKYVFEGEIKSKIYSKDSLTYKVVFDISKHYKKGDSPKNLEFELTSEGKYTGQYTSCDWQANLNEKWLVYAYYYKEKIHYSGICSNSKSINYRTIGSKEQKMLDHGNSFEIDNYIFENESEFNYCKNITDINSILKYGKRKKYKNPIAFLSVFIDSYGNLKSVSRDRELNRIKDSIFDITTGIEYRNSRPKTEFEKDAIELINQVKKWEVKKHRETNFSVPYIRHVWVSYDLKTNKWNYEL